MKYDTKSEMLFSTICDRHGYSIEKIPTKSVEMEKSPDFSVKTPSGEFIAEIKEIAPNEDDLRQIREIKENGWSCGGGTIGSRARRKIRKASEQLRLHKDDGVPLIVVLYDNARVGDYRVAHPMYYTEPHHIDAAMYGQRVTHVSLREGAICKPDYNGGSRTTTDSEKIYISAVVVISDWDDEHLIVYHNYFADHSLPLSIFNDSKSSHFGKGIYVYGEPWHWNKIEE